jgi:hypothetical protein
MSALRAKRRRLQTAAALVRYGGDLLLDMQEATITLDLGRGLFYALSVQCRLVELMQTRDIERRLAAIEERLASNSSQREMNSRSVPWSA